MFSITEYENNQIPSLNDFQISLNELEKFYQENKKSIHSLSFYGSFLINQHSEASDIDCIFIPKKPELLGSFSDIIRSIDSKLNVDVEVNPIDYDLSLEGLHTINSSFTQHLNLALTKEEKKNYGINPLKIISNISPSDIESIPNSAKNSLIYKFWQISKKKFWKTNEEHNNYLENILESSPYHCSRLYLQYHYPEMFGKNIEDSKANIVKLYKEHHGPNKEFLEEMFELRKKYLNLLKNRKKETLDLEKYRNLQNEIDCEFLNLYEFVKTQLKTML